MTSIWQQTHSQIPESVEALRQVVPPLTPPSALLPDTVTGRLLGASLFLLMRQTDPGNINLPHMLQLLAAWIIAGEKQTRNHDRLAEAESLILEARNLFVRHYGENHGATLSADGNLCSLAITRGDLERAKSICEQNLIRSRQLDEGGYNHIWALFYLSKANLALGKKTEADMLFQQATERGLKKWGAKTLRYEQLVKEIGLARAVERR
jgi:hypothetical protein